MAGGQERILRGRIRSMQATKKITRAMELIAASRIVKAQARVQAAVPYANGITDVVRMEPITCDGGAVQDESDERDIHLLFERQIDDAWHSADRGSHSLSEASQSAKIVTEDLDRDVGPRAGQHVIDPVRNRLPNRDVRPGQRRETSPQSRQ